MSHLDAASLPLPPPYPSQDDKIKYAYTLYTSTATHQANQFSSSHNNHIHSVTQLVFRDKGRRRVRYSALIPKKREGWKADLSYVTEKEREQPRCEIRREPMARKFDFRDPQGYHNVMIPSNSLNNRTFSIEATDGQKLMWKRQQQGWDLISLPSNTLLAQYSFSSRSDHRQNEQGQTETGSLEIYVMPETTDIGPNFLKKSKRTNSTNSTASSTSSEGSPRLGRAHRQLAIGLCAPAIISAGIASPYSSAGMNRLCIIGDELGNLGRTSIKPAAKVLENENAEFRATRENWMNMNDSAHFRKIDDPRPRNVEADLVVSSLIAVLAG